MNPRSALALAGALLLVAGASAGGAGEARVLATDRDFDGLAPFAARPVVAWQWNAEEKARADQFSRVELARDASGAMLLSLKVSPEFPFKRGWQEILTLGMRHLPPEADALRLKVRALSGKVLFGFGGPTAYFGNSDAFLRPVAADASADGADWRTVEFSLHHGLLRNFRRASYSEQAPDIAYARWAQEPTFLYVFKGSAGEIQVKDLEVVARGLAQPFPAFGPGDTAPVATLADFAATNALARAFSALVGENDAEFEPSWARKEPGAHPPPAYALATDPEAGPVLRATGKFLEEMAAIGLLLDKAGEGDALRFRLKVDTEAPNGIVPSVDAQPLDLLLYGAPDPSAFDWRPFLPPAEWLKGPGRGFDRDLAYRKLRGTPGLSLAIFHARRFVPKGRWSEVVVPLDDFLCLYGCGELAARFQKRLGPEPSKLLAAAVLAPWPRKGRFETAISLRDVALVKFAREPASRRSYFQPPAAEARPLVKSPRGRLAAALAPGEAELPPAIRQLLEQMD
jgi:hypothetical protein